MVPRSGGRKRGLKKARGFSLGELKQAGLDRSQPHHIGIGIDARRSTIHNHNVVALKQVLAASMPKASVSYTSAEAAQEGSEAKRGSAPAAMQTQPSPARRGRVQKRRS